MMAWLLLIVVKVMGMFVGNLLFANNGDYNSKAMVRKIYWLIGL